jgi:uracil-DNA glycosylase
MAQTIEEFVDLLANTPAPPHARNLWDHSRPENVIRRNNLLGYLAAMQAYRPTALLVGEAPGYRGCGRVGMPFSSEKLVLEHPFFADRSIFAVEHADAPMGEASASIVWKTFDALGYYPLMWAAYPFHPHAPGDPLTNRAPRPDEVALGSPFIKHLIGIFGITDLVAVGRVAEKTLSGLGYAAHPVRHPSHGGAVLFAEGLREYHAAKH